EQIDFAQLGQDAQATEPATEIQMPEQKGVVQRIMEDVVRRSGLEALYRKDVEHDEIGEGPVANINELISSAAEYDRDNAEGSLDEYLANVSLVSDADHMKGAGGAVTLM